MPSIAKGVASRIIDNVRKNALTQRGKIKDLNQNGDEGMQKKGVRKEGRLKSEGGDASTPKRPLEGRGERQLSNLIGSNRLHWNSNCGDVTSQGGS